MNLLQERILAFAKRGRAVPNCVVVSSPTENSAGGGGGSSFPVCISHADWGTPEHPFPQRAHTALCEQKEEQINNWGPGNWLK